jgi:hypothetical protein
MTDQEDRIRKLEIQIRYLLDIDRALVAAYADQSKGIYDAMNQAERTAAAEGLRWPLYCPSSQR